MAAASQPATSQRATSLTWGACPRNALLSCLSAIRPPLGRTIPRGSQILAPRSAGSSNESWLRESRRDWILVGNQPSWHAKSFHPENAVTALCACSAEKESPLGGMMQQNCRRVDMGLSTRVYSLLREVCLPRVYRPSQDDDVSCRHGPNDLRDKLCNCPGEISPDRPRPD